MNVKILAIALLILLLLSGSVYPQAKSAVPATTTPTVAFNPAPARLGFINLERALTDVAEGKQLFGELQGYIDKKNKELEAMQGDITRKENQLRTQTSTLSDDAKAGLQREIEEQRTRLARFQEDTAKDIERRQNANITKIGQKMQPLIQEFAKEQNLSSVIVWSPQIYAYVDESLNVTDVIIKRYDAKYPVAAAAAKPKN